MNLRRLQGWLASAVLLSVVLSVVLGVALGALAPTAITTVTTTLDLEIGDTPILAETPRIGLNLGQWTSWGAEQLSRNIVKNPGFEGAIARTLVRATDVHRHDFSDDEAWLARPDGFWATANFEVLTGAAAGQVGRILDSVASNADGRPEYRLAEPVNELAEGDIIALTLTRDDLPPERWWLPEPGEGMARSSAALVAPDSPGRRSLGLYPDGQASVRLASHFDAIGKRAGKLLPVNGQWRLGMWIHGAAAGAAQAHIRFHRHGSTPFVDIRHAVAPGWHYLSYSFDASDSGPVGALELSIDVSGGVVHLDDIWLGAEALQGAAPQDGGSLATEIFNPQLIRLLEQLRPGYLRDWQGQLGDTLDNRLAPPFARRTSSYRPGDGDFGYGLPEFLDLNRLVGAQPWLILPTTFSPDEARQLGAWLADKIEEHDFEEVIVEFGNENWNALFRPAGIQHPDHHGAAADRLFSALREGAGGHHAIRTAINAQYVNPHSALRFAAASQQADILALAPYFLNKLDAADRDRATELLFAANDEHMASVMDDRPGQQEIAVYEINLHAIQGDMPQQERDALVTSPAAGAALARHLLNYLNRGIRRQNVYQVTGYDTFLQDSRELTQLFGIARDLSAPSSLRPTGRAVEMLNRVIGGELHPITVTGATSSSVTASAFRHAGGWAVALVSQSPHPQTLRLRFPADDAAMPLQSRLLSEPAADFPIALEVEEREIELILPPFSLVTLDPDFDN